MAGAAGMGAVVAECGAVECWSEVSMGTAAPLSGGGGGNSLAPPGTACDMAVGIVIGTASPAADRTAMGATARVVANMCAPGAATPTPMGAAPIDAMYCCSGYPPPTPTPGYAAITFAAMGACCCCCCCCCATCCAC